MSKLGILVEREVGTPSRGLHPCSVDVGKSNSRRSVSPIARSASKEPTSKVVETGGAGDLAIVVSPEILSGSQKASSGHEELEQVNEVSSGAIRLVWAPSSNPGISAHGGDAKKEVAPKHKRARLTEGEKLTLEALPILKKNDVVEKLRSSPLKNLQVVDKRRADKPPLGIKTSKKTKTGLKYNVGDVVHICGHEEEDLKTTFIGKGIVKNLAGGMLHNKVIGGGYISLIFTETYKDDYPLCFPLSEDDPPITTIGNAKGHYVLWPNDCARLYAPA